MLLENHNAIESGGYQISNSLRFQSASSQYLSRTPSVAGNRTTWTWSGWVKRGSLGVRQDFAGIDNSNKPIYFLSDDTLATQNYNGVGADYYIQTTSVYRDPASWYHIVSVWDSSNATASERQRLYVNGQRITAFTSGNTISLNATSVWNSATAHSIGRNTAGGFYSDGYLTEVNFIDGQALTPSSFGETDITTGQWVAKKYTGTYGTNGFYLPFSDGTSTTTLGNDGSGNANHWTLTNFTRSAGVSDCWMNDVPSGNGSNYAVLNPLNMMVSNYMTTSRANLAAVRASNAGDGAISSTMNVNSGKWYWEVIVSGSNTNVGIVKDSDSYAVQNTSFYIGSSSTSYGYYKTGQKINAATLTAYGSAYTANAVIGVALDLDTGTIIFYKDGISQGVAFTGIIGNFSPALSDYPSTTNHFNFGQRSFQYTPPSGFKALCTANLPAATIKKGNMVFDVTLYTGDGTSSKAIANTYGFNPDLVWIKNRSNAVSHVLVDAVRGASNNLASDLTAAENSGGNAPATYGTVSALNSNGFTVAAGTDPTYKGTNGSGQTYVAWQWDAGSSTVTNTNGTISSSVRANATAGVSVITYTGNGVGGATVGHGLGVAPSMIIVKGRSVVSNWITYHKNMSATPQNNFLLLNGTAAVSGTDASAWFNTSPTSSVFSIGAYNVSNGSTYVAYCFAEIAGFSKFGSYTGNGSTDGTFVYTGFRPKFILIKASSQAGNDWQITDTSRSPYNAAAAYLYPDLPNAEGGSSFPLDVLSNGFKLRNTAGDNNNSGVTFIFAAFAESPFASSNAR